MINKYEQTIDHINQLMIDVNSFINTILTIMSYFRNSFANKHAYKAKINHTNY